MGDTLTCPECGAEAESVEDVGTVEVPEIEVEGEGHSFNLFGNRDLFLCKDCKRPLGMPRL